ncbi:hypothetical protein HL658_10065 [Azospirillum sp. RWY-5-1]|uniref:Phage tail protein n=1 Tax=Azospirillum oleiclasticum TaxID=2735135 RepID=A0ABX2T7Z9_9PROT|nr:hypothetical protein [Azospirillum oleiclasticum]NYZ12897.1 hypothetical protein [Azospirillum oleiclasticum]NYZ20430.1 hypothetical protein [Azospirillum oleiclasticum]
MALTAIGLCSRALLRIGATPISAFDDGTAEAQVADALYAPARDALLTANAWSFATAQATLPRLSDPPLADFANAFQLPADFLRALGAGIGGRGRGLEYRIAGRRLHADAESVVLTYLFRPAEADFPAFFDQALIARLSAEFCIPLTENSSRAETMMKLAETEFRRARLIDAQQDVQPRFEDFTLIEARGS